MLHCRAPPAPHGLPPGPRRVPAHRLPTHPPHPRPAPILSLYDSHGCAGGLTAEATGPPLPSASRRERDPRHPRDWEKPALPSLRPPGIMPGSGKAAALPPLGEVGPPRGAAKASRVKLPETQISTRAFNSTLHLAPMCRGPGSARPQPLTRTLQWLEPTLEPGEFLPAPAERQDAGGGLGLLG